MAQDNQYSQYQTYGQNQQAAIDQQAQADLQQKQELEEKIARITEAYKQAVLYFNPDLSDYEAELISRSILYYGIAFKIDPKLVVSVIAVESKFRPNAVSPKGAQGLGQLMPGTARLLGVSNPLDPVQNIYGTVKYLHMQRMRWANMGQNVLDYMLAAYNAGPEAVEKYSGIPPYAETRNYVRHVKELYSSFKR